jgi:hypothetical protein
MDHERYPYYFEEDSRSGGRFISDLYEMLLNAISRLAVPAAQPVFARFDHR